MSSFSQVELVSPVSEGPPLPSHQSPELHWYVAYTRPRHEKRVEQQMQNSGIDCFLPLYLSLRRWKDRRKQLQLPLFPGYVFVHFSLTDRLRVLQLPGVLEFVTFQGRPAVLAETEMEILRNGLDPGRAEPYPFLTVGRRVRIHAGPVAGLEGVLVRRKNRMRVVVSIDSIQRAIAVEVDAKEIEPASR